MKAEQMFKDRAEWLLDLVFPPRCPLCDRILLKEEGMICASCKKLLPWSSEPRCGKCGRKLTDKRTEYCRGCCGTSHHFVQGECTFVYEGNLRDSILRMKFENRREYIPFFFFFMAQFHEAFLARVKPQTLLPVPLYEEKRKERGFDQCALLAKELSGLTGIRCADRSVVRIKKTKAQKGLDYAARQQNLEGAFQIVDGTELREPLLIVDDIFTTGATIDSLSGALKKNGYSQIFFLALSAPADRA